MCSNSMVSASIGTLCRRNDNNYRPLPIEISLGPDLATSLRTVWNELEDYAGSLDRLCRQFAQVKFEVVEGPALACRIRLSEPQPSCACLDSREENPLLLRGCGPDIRSRTKRGEAGAGRL